MMVQPEATAQTCRLRTSLHGQRTWSSADVRSCEARVSLAILYITQYIFGSVLTVRMQFNALL